ncbi:MAG: hypothetical protein MK008_00195 [Bdellovibrionales bacterium]|nr:hypothetical protein [Bdellovibrionales bacterium]
MKYINIIIFSLIASKAMAEVSIETNLKASALVKYSKKTWYKNSTKCYPFGAPGDKTDFLKQVTVESDSANKFYKNSSNIQYDVFSNSVFKVHASKLKLSYRKKELGDKSSVSLKMTQFLYPTHQTQLDNSGCLRTDGLARALNPSVEGVIKVRYKVPNNVWLIKVNYTEFSDIFSINHLSKFKNTFNQSYELKQNEKYIWVRPNTVITQEIRIPKQSKLTGDIGTAKITFENMQSNDKNVIDKINNNDHNYKDSVELDEYVDSISSFVNNPELLTHYLNNISLNKSITLADKFFKIANMNLGSSENAHLKKTLSAILSFEISKNILKNFEKYCTEIEVYNPDHMQRIKANGLIAAYFWLNRALIRIENFDLLGVKNFLSKLQQLSNENKTYYDVMADDKLRLKLKKAYELLVNTTNADTTPFSAALFDLELILSNFGSFTNVSTSEDKLFTAMNRLADIEDSFWVAFDKDLRAFNKAEKIIINVQRSSSILNEIHHENLKVLDLLKNKTHLLDVVNNESTDSFISYVTDLLVHQVNIFEEDVDVDYFDSIRDPYQLDNGIKPLSEKIQSCLLGV